MKNNDQKLSELFSLSRDAVLGIRDGLVVFANGSARERFGDCVGRPGSSLLPECIFEQSEESFVCTLPGEGEALTVSASHLEGLLLLFIPRPETPELLIPETTLSELRTTSYNLRMASELILERAPADEKLSTYAAILHHNYYGLLRLVRNLSDVAALCKGPLSLRKEPLDLRDLYGHLTDSAAHFLKERGSMLHFDAAEGEYLLHGDRERLEQLLLNLLANALGHTDRSGRIHVRLSRQGGNIVLAVDDSGSGIPARELSLLFSARDNGQIRSGAGLGLRVVQGIVSAHGGSLMLQSDGDQGTRVRVMLPASRTLPLRDADRIPTGPGLILTELSSVLGHEAYDKRYMD